MHVGAQAGPMRPIEVLANPDCPHCLHALDDVTEAAARGGVPVAGIDLRRHAEVAEGFEHSPLFRVGGRVFQGPLDAELLRALLDEARRA